MKFLVIAVVLAVVAVSRLDGAAHLGTKALLARGAAAGYGYGAAARALLGRAAKAGLEDYETINANGDACICTPRITDDQDCDPSSAARKFFYVYG